MEIPKVEEKIETPVNDEAELDKALEDSINEVKAGKVLTPVKEEVKVEAPKESEEEIPKEPAVPKPEDTSTPPVADEKKEGEYDFRIPNKGKFESDEAYEKRIELMDLVKRKRLAKTEEQKQQLSEQIDTAKGQLKNISGSNKITNSLSKKSEVEVEKKVEEEDPVFKADRERLIQLGGATKEDIENIIRKQQLEVETRSTIEKFVERHSELKDADTRDVFFDFVDSNYNWQNKSGKDLMTVLELARESMFKPSETIQERVLKAANVQEKVNAMQFPGGTLAKQAHSPEIQKSIDEMKATGMSEEKALELISD